ncbi:alpha/beta fold hydrolase [Microtetraspora sp. AC03309]|uniref:alpha/beta fold hydrolase n=1 Tax=Microtetraspora sp. AC03309 TaxID=2779376 RepID=UPI001E5111AE|nr:alpha/beta hydrolase [Microtetraspora sp. AC03309]MCC5580333.1 alpha/beta fold hydrolase [Microtetraspora sp. AC03309]
MTDTETTQVDRFVDVPNFRIHYVEAGTGHPVVLLHGSGPGATGLTNFAPNIGALAKKFRVIAVDMPGWGESDTQTEETGRDHPKVLIDFLDKLGIEKAALVGNSMGGVTSISTAILHPERVSHLITMGAPAPLQGIFSPGGGITEGLKVLLHAYREPTPENMKRLVQVMCFDQTVATDELAAARSAAALARPDHLESWNSQFNGPPKPSPYWHLAGREATITAPSLMIHGRDDRVVHYENSLHLVARIPNSRMVLLNRCGHWAQIEHAAEFNRLVSAFIEQ